MLKKYKISFDIWALLLFLIIMIPNFIWCVIPAPNDILRVDSVTGGLDTFASICQIVMIVALCVIINPECEKRNVVSMIAVCVCCLLYFGSWILYYAGMTNAIVILGLTIPPCMAFVIFAVARRNMVAVIPGVIFLGCHVIYGIVNFII